MLEFAAWLQQTPLNTWLQSQAWVVPTMQTIHIIMLAVLFGSIMMICLRIIGRVWADAPPAAVINRFGPWFWAALGINVFTGLVLTLAEPVREFSSTSYWVKMTLLLIGAAGAFTFQKRLKPLTADGASVEPTQAMRVGAVATMTLWVAVIFLGRAIAYDVEVWGALSLSAGS